MFILSGKEARAEIREQSEIDSVLVKLEDSGGKALLRSMVRALCDAAGIPHYKLKVDSLLSERAAYRRVHRGKNLVGDLLSYPDRMYLLFPQGRKLIAWEVRHHSVHSGLDDFCSSVEKAIRTRLDGRRVRGMQFDWRETKVRPAAFGARMHRRRTVGRSIKTTDAAFTPEQLTQVQLIRSHDHRVFLLQLAEIGRARSIDAASVADADITDPLLEKNLISQEFLVTCRQDSKTLCSTTDRTTFESEAGLGMHCTSCGRAFKDELIQEIYALTPAAKELLTSSRWMTIWITDLLVQAGVELNSIQWNPETSDEELDLMATILGERVLFELKDREFGLGDAYPFGFRIQRYGGRLGIVATTEKVSEDAKRFFDEEVSVPISIMEGEQEIEEKIQEIVSNFSRSSVERFFMEFSEELGVDMVSIIRAWMQDVSSPKVAASIAS